MMNAQRLATTLDYEKYAREILDMQTFDHLQGTAIIRPEENISDYDLIKLKALGLMSMEKFKGTPTSILPNLA